MKKRSQHVASNPKLKLASPTSRSESQLHKSSKQSESFKHLKQQNSELHKKLQLKVSKIKKLRQTLQVITKENTDVSNQPTPREATKSSRQKPTFKKDIVQGIIQAQQVTKNTLEGYRRLQQQFSDYRKNAVKKIEQLTNQVEELQHINNQKEREMKLRQQEMNSKKRLQTQDLKNKAATLQEQLNRQIHNNTSLTQRIKELIQEVETLRSENHQIKEQNSRLEEEATIKEKQYRANLNEITHRLERFSQRPHDNGESSTQELQMLREKYATLMEKYTRKKLRFREVNREWRTVTEQLLLRCRAGGLEEMSPQNRQEFNASQY